MNVSTRIVKRNGLPNKMYVFSEHVFDIRSFIKKIEKMPENRIVLFGAGGWGEALLEELERLDVASPIAFADNDPTKQGLCLKGKTIIEPQMLDFGKDIVAITTISAGFSVSNQLEGLGFERNINYFEVMRSLIYEQPLNVIDFYLTYARSFAGLDVLHIGPGGNLGVELLLKLLGARLVSSVEYDSFGILYPDVTDAKEFYYDLAQKAVKRGHGDLWKTGLLKSYGSRLLIEKSRIHLVHPCLVEALPFVDECFDLILHHAVFEHVADPKKGYEEIFRTLKPGGMTVGLVGPQDHRSFSSFKEYHPLKFLEYSRQEWYAISKQINFHNQITFPEHKSMIVNQGFILKDCDAMERMEIMDEMWDRFNPMFKTFDTMELGVLLFSFAAIKP